jgi:hypothetical protein
VITDQWARGVKESLSGDLTAMYTDLQQQWDDEQWPWETAKD